jgi:dipeptidyl aminopeptidase/acylaminoacyl peptidase
MDRYNQNMLRAAIAVSIATVCSAQGAPFDAAALMRITRLSEPHLSPEGRLVAYTARTVDVEANTQPRQIFVVASEGGTPRQLTRDGSINERPRWSPDSKTIAFISNRSGSSQIWLMNADGSNARQVTDLSTEASGVMWAPDGANLLFVSEVYPECRDDACNKRKLEAEKENKVKARIYTSLLYRHWNDWKTARRRHLMVVPADGGVARDLTPGIQRDVPPFSLGGPDDYAIAPNSGEVCFAMNDDDEQALSTNWDLFVTPLSGSELRKITLNPAADASPAYSPDGLMLAYRAQVKPGYESDKWRLVVMDRTTGVTTTLTEMLDRSVQSLSWSPDSKRIFFTVEDRGRTSLNVIPAAGGGIRQIIAGQSHVDDVQLSPDARFLIYSEHSGSKPVEFYRVNSTGGPATALTGTNRAVLASHDIRPLEELSVSARDGTKVHSFLLKPPGFSAQQKYPVLFLIHGGPQGAWGESWSYRWNPQVFAAAGFVVVLPNPRGSTGYGQQFTDDINQDWGGKVYEDLNAVFDYVAKQPWADGDRFAAAGGSYGGYMVNWILGHSDRFRALVSHAGVFDLRSMAGETEELWFPMWEFGGMPWDNPRVYEKWSPSYFVENFKTPTLVIHGELDYRVPVGQGLQLFTALQMQKVPSKLLLYPDEGHWILKPQNSLLWYKSVIDWVTEFTAKKDRATSQP